MANTYTQIYYHIVFAVKYRAALITAEIKEDLYKYMNGIVTTRGQRVFAINGVADHVHLLINCEPNINLSNLVKEVKEHSSKFINEKKILRSRFYWQGGFGAFSVSKQNVPMIQRYIENQEAHHRKTKFREEYISFMKEHEIDYKEEYLFDFDL